MKGFTAAKKNETTINQMTSLEKAVKAWVKLSVFVKMETVTARNAHAPVGRGSSTRPVSHNNIIRAHKAQNSAGSSWSRKSKMHAKECSMNLWTRLQWLTQRWTAGSIPAW